MLRIMALLALATLATAFDHDHLLQLESAILARFDAPPQNQTFYFPCNGLEGMRYKKNLDVQRDLGQWFSTNVAFPVSHHYSVQDIQDYLTRSIGCSKLNVNASSAGGNNVVSTMDQVYRAPVNSSQYIPDGGVVVNGNTIRFTRRGFPARQGDFGWWILEYVNATSGNKFQADGFVIDTDYTNFKISYSCSDLPVPFSADTDRVQQWVLSRRQPWAFSALEIAAFEIAVRLHGIHDKDNLFQLATDQC